MWESIPLITEQGDKVIAQAPLIISASRRTDIPAWYADWFFHRLRVGYSVVRNPFTGAHSYISYAKTRCIVFWSKNPQPLLAHLPYLRERNIVCYIQYTLNDYVHEGLEPAVPPLQERLATLQQLAKILGKERVIWRFDPLILQEGQSLEDLLAKIASLGRQVQGYTEKLVISFVDIAAYRKVQQNLQGYACRELSDATMRSFARELAALNTREQWGYALAACGERIDLTEYGIARNACVDADLLVRLCPHDTTLLQFLGRKPTKQLTLLEMPCPREYGKTRKDTGQRQFCGCAPSMDIGQYDTCLHQCAYCYATSSTATAHAQYARHRANPWGALLTGEL